MARKIAVIGLGNFGNALAITLTRLGAEVCAIDEEMEYLDDIKDAVTHTVCLDSTDERALKAQGLDEFDAVVVGIGDNFEASLLTVTSLQKIGVERIIARATSPTHKHILNHLGVKEVILPAVEAAERLASTLMYERIVDSFALSSDYTIAEVTAPAELVGKSLESLGLVQRYGVTLITIKRIEKKSSLLGFRERDVEQVLGVLSGNTRVEMGDVLVVFGTKQSINGAFGS